MIINLSTACVIVVLPQRKKKHSYHFRYRLVLRVIPNLQTEETKAPELVFCHLYLSGN